MKVRTLREIPAGTHNGKAAVIPKDAIVDVVYPFTDWADWGLDQKVLICWEDERHSASAIVRASDLSPPVDPPLENDPIQKGDTAKPRKRLRSWPTASTPPPAFRKGLPPQPRVVLLRRDDKFALLFLAILAFTVLGGIAIAAVAGRL